MDTFGLVLFICGLLALLCLIAWIDAERSGGDE